MSKAKGTILTLALALAALVGVAGTPGTAEACWDCSWEYGCVPGGYGSWSSCYDYQPHGPGGDWFCSMSGRMCTDWYSAAGLERSEVTADGTFAGESYEGAVELAAVAAQADADGRELARACSGVILSRSYSAPVAAEMKKATSTILI